VPDITHVLSEKYKGMEWSLSGEPTTEAEFNEGFTIHKANGVTVPTWVKLQTQLAELQAEYDAKQYQRDRLPEYPPATDYLDGVVKGDQGQIDKYIADCLAVKQRFPK